MNKKPLTISNVLIVRTRSDFSFAVQGCSASSCCAGAGGSALCFSPCVFRDGGGDGLASPSPRRPCRGRPWRSDIFTQMRKEIVGDSTISIQREWKVQKISKKKCKKCSKT